MSSPFFYHSLPTTHVFSSLKWSPVDRGANIEVFDKDHETPLSLALFHDGDAVFTPIANVLLRHGAAWERFCLKYNASDVFRNIGCTTFSYAIALGHLQEAWRLLETNPVWLVQPDRFGHTPLMRAVINDQVEAVEQLLLRGADANAVDHHGQTAVYFAVRNWQESRRVNTDNQDILELLGIYNVELNDKTCTLLETKDLSTALSNKLRPYYLK